VSLKQFSHKLIVIVINVTFSDAFNISGLNTKVFCAGLARPVQDFYLTC